MSQETPPLWRKLYDGWMSITARFGAVQTMILLAFIYVVVVGPVSAFMRIARRDPLDKRSLGKGPSAWRDADSARADLERAKLQA